MIALWKCRPITPVDPNDGEVDDWEDNWLSNSFAWASKAFFKGWCDTPEHWTSRFTVYLYTTCGCCLIWRGVFLGAGAVFALDVLAILFYYGIIAR